MPVRFAARVERLARIGARADDSYETRVRKEMLVLAVSVIILLAWGWVGTYAALGLWIPAAIPFAYQVAASTGLVYLARTGRETGLVTAQLAFWVGLPFFLQWSLGGFVASSAVGFWALASPFAAIVFQGARASVRWFALFAALLVLSAVLDPLLPSSAGEIPYWLRVAFFTCNIAGVSVTAFLLLLYFVRARERAHAALAVERERSERLLLNVLPEPIAERLKGSDGLIADRHPDVTVLFADIDGFTPAAERLAPERVVGLLDEVFSGFDELVAARSLEKIKTIGDGYMVAGGVPAGRPDHAEVVADLALAMRDGFHAVAGENELSVRIGIDTGPVVAGVIGRRKFGYDLWGDTVNTASRMESHAPPGTIQVTEGTHERIADRFRFERRDGVLVKGKGILTTYLLLGRRDAAEDPEVVRLGDVAGPAA